MSKKKNTRSNSATALKERPAQTSETTTTGWVPRDGSDLTRELDAKRKEREAKKENREPLSVRAHDRFGARGVKTIHIGLTILSRLAVAAITYVLLAISATTAVPLLGVLMLGVSGVSDDSGTLAILATWLAPLIFLVIVMVIVEWLIVRALWNLAAKSTKQMGRNLGVIEDNAPSKEN